MEILLFAGTTEGRNLAGLLGRLPVHVYVSTATEYGKECLDAGSQVDVIAGRMDGNAIAHFMRENQIDLAVDATHPFARAVSGNIKNACSICGVEYIRCIREQQDMEALELENVIFRKSVADAVEYLKEKEGSVFITTGSKELKLYTELKDYKERCFARVLSTREAVEESTALGFKGANLIAMQGPFSKEMNVAMLNYTGAAYFVTKESGKAGGFEEKARAAKETGATLIVITRPEESGISLEETLRIIKRRAAENGE